MTSTAAFTASLDRPSRRRRLSYRLLRAWARAAVSVFYRRVDVCGAEEVPRERPVIFAANHTNALADVALIIAKAPRFPHFLAASAWWKRRSARALFELGGVLPIQRNGDAPGPLDNRGTFAACTDALAAGSHLAIFPEGVMHLEPELRPLKTGAARIGLGAADLGVAGVVIVPVGLVYEARGRFRSDVTITFGHRITMDDWIEQYRIDAYATARTVTQLLGEELARATIPRPADRRRPAGARSPVDMTSAILAVPAAAGLVANAPAILFGVLARAVCDESWQATVKGVAGTALLPLAWIAEIAFGARRVGSRRAFALAATGIVSGFATLAWIDRRIDVTLCVPLPRSNGSRRSVDEECEGDVARDCGAEVQQEVDDLG